VINTSREAGYEVIQWNIDTLDWREKDPDVIIKRVMSKLEPGSIILCHNNGYGMETYLPAIISAIKKQGYRFEMVSEMLLKGDSYVNLQGMQCPKAGAKPSADSTALEASPELVKATMKPTKSAKPAKATSKPKATPRPKATPKPAKATPMPVKATPKPTDID